MFPPPPDYSSGKGTAMGKTEPEPVEMRAIRINAAAWLASGKPCAFVVVVPRPGMEPVPLCGMVGKATLDEGTALAVMLAAAGRSLMRGFAITTSRPEAVEEVLISLDAEVRKISEKGMVCRSQIVEQMRPNEP